MSSTSRKLNSQSHTHLPGRDYKHRLEVEVPVSPLAQGGQLSASAEVAGDDGGAGLRGERLKGGSSVLPRKWRVMMVEPA